MRNHERCGGTIIAKNAILTAANCLYDQKEKRWAYAKEVFVLHSDFSSQNNWPSTCCSCDHFVAHEADAPEKYGWIKPYDIAIIKLHTKLNLTSARKSKLKPYYNDLRNFEKGYFIGLGLIIQDPDTQPEQLMQVVLQAVTTCGLYNRWHGIIVEGLQVCYSFRRRAACTGDTGGPIVHKKHYRTRCLIGISSYNMNSVIIRTILTSSQLFGRLKRGFRNNFQNCN